MHACMWVAVSVSVPFQWPMEGGHSFLHCYSLVKPISPVKPHLSHSLFSQSTPPPPPILLPVKGGQSLAIQWQKNTVSDWCK